VQIKVNRKLNSNNVILLGAGQASSKEPSVPHVEGLTIGAKNEGGILDVI